jgi:hypothetical protein
MMRRSTTKGSSEAKPPTDAPRVYASDELIAERRAEVAKEEEEERRWLRARRAKEKRG